MRAAACCARPRDIGCAEHYRLLHPLQDRLTTKGQCGYGAILLLDLDHFKYVNDTLGHQIGDELLINLSKLLKERLRETDTIARLGGDECAAILPNTSADQSQVIAKQILDIVQGYTLGNNGHSPGVTASIGIAIFPDHGDTRETLLACADFAMYQAKESGRNRVCVFSSDQKTKAESRITWEKHIRDALKHDRFVLHVQPTLDLKSNRIIAYEALLRMECESGETLFPTDLANRPSPSTWVMRRP